MSLDKSKVTYLCQRCGNCCRWPGDVIVTAVEIKAIAAHLGMDEVNFIQRFTRLRANRRHLSIIGSEDGACLFLEGENACCIQPVKPYNRHTFNRLHDTCEAWDGVIRYRLELYLATRWQRLPR